MSQVENSNKQVDAYSIPVFCERYGVGKSFVFEQIKNKKLKARKAGHRTLIFRTDAEAWAASLPVSGAA